MYSPGTALTHKGEFVYNPCLKFYITASTPGNRVHCNDKGLPLTAGSVSSERK